MDTVRTYRARRRLKMTPTHWREPGQLVPEVVTWFRIDDSLHTGRLIQVQVSPEEFEAAIAEFCPQLGDRIRELTGLNGERLRGLHRSPVRTVRARSALTPGQRQWALDLDPGPLIGPVPRTRRPSLARELAAEIPARKAAPRKAAPRKAGPRKAGAATKVAATAVIERA